MKKFNHYVLNGAIALLSTAGFVACSSSDDVTDAPVNPTYDGKSVKTQFAINIATPVTGNPSTRMSDANTQNGTNVSFLGMNNIKLMTFKSGDELNVTTSSANRTTSTQLDQIIALSNLGTTDISSSNSSKIYTDVYIPVGTTNFLFYGTGPIGTSTNSDRFEKGTLTVPSSLVSGQTLNDINYSLVMALDENTGFENTAKSFADYLDKIVDSSFENTSTTTTSTWASLGTDDKWATLSTAYNNFIHIGTTGARGGSANAILFTLKQLYEICDDLATNSSDEDVKGLAGAIKKNITNKDNTNAKIKVKATAETDTNGKTTGYKLEYDGLTDEYKTFPTTFGLPEGAAQLTFDDTNKFEYATNSKIGSSTGTGINVSFNPSNVAFPAALTYFVNTPARATTKEIATTGTTDVWPKTVSAWDAVWGSTGSFNDWTTTVNSNSRTVALQYNINYGVACLTTTVKCADKAYLEDNSKASNSESSNLQISIPDAGFKVTGILIGGQSKTVGWDFLDPSSTNQTYVVYDNALSSISAKRKTESSKNYTLVFDNYIKPTGSDTKQPAVNIALELENGNEEFFGVDGRIAPGQKFYLVAKLDPNDVKDSNNTTGTATTSNVKWPDDDKSRFPAKNVNRVFIQDHTTVANFTINSLKNAYVTIPDLRASKLQLGLSVDLTWQSGLTFDVPIE